MPTHKTQNEPITTALRRFLDIATFALTAACVTLASVSSATSPPVPKRPPPPPQWEVPRFIVPPSFRAERPIQVQTLRVSADVSPGSATTEIDITFFNPNAQVLEGELQFPLLDGQSIVSFAMDVNGKMRDAVPVEKAKGQAVFEDVIRQRIDPGLLEVTQGNNFKLRVYPLPGNGTKRVILRLNENLRAQNGQWQYRLPLGVTDRAGTLNIDVRAVGMSAPPTLTREPLSESGAWKFSREWLGRETTWRLKESVRDARLDPSHATLNLAFDANSNGAPTIFTQRFDGKNYFAASIPVKSQKAPRAMPRVLNLVWDSSRSARDADQARIFQLLDGVFARMQDGEVRLTRVRNMAERTETFTIRNGNWSTLRDALRATNYDGATNLSAVTIERNAGAVILVSDGLNNFADKSFAPTNVPLFTVSAQIKTDAAFLSHMAERSGGRYVDLLTTDAAMALTAITQAETRFSVDDSGVNDAMLPHSHARDGRLDVVGQLASNAGELAIRATHPDGREEVIRVPLSADRMVESNVAAYRWASTKLAALDAEAHLNRGEIRRLGQRFRIPTRETSLIILDRIEDYVRNEIEPPEELRADYDRMIAQQGLRQRNDRANHLQRVLQQLDAKVRWWEHRFPKGPRFENEAPTDKPRPTRGDRAVLMSNETNAPNTQNPRERSDARTMDRREMAAPAAPAMAAPPPSGSPVAQSFAESAAGSARKAAQVGGLSAPNSVIRLQKWQPDAAYARRMRDASREELYRVYLDEAGGYVNSSAFYLDAADIFFDRGMNELGVRVLSNLAEMDLENRHILRILGYRLMQAKQAPLAIMVLKRVLALSPEEPQSYRDLGLAYAANNQPQAAVDSLYEVVVRPWHGRFPEIELITLADMNAVIANAKEKLDVSRIDPRLLRNMPLDLRVVLTWDADNTDIDLWVTDPNGDKAYYGNRNTYQGGRMSQDFTGGYGPEEFSLREAKPGKYRIEAQYFGDRRQLVTGVTTLQVRVTKNFGRRGSADEIITLRLKDQKELVFVGEIDVGGR
jgi:Ca-activated chloride channel homolog